MKETTGTTQKVGDDTLDDWLVLRGINLPEFHVKPKRHNGRIGWKARAIQAQQDLKEMRVKMWVCGGIGVAVGAVGVTVMFFILTIVN